MMIKNANSGRIGQLLCSRPSSTGLTASFAATIVVALAASAAPASAAFPGANGKIAYDRFVATGSSTNHIFVMNPDGTGQVDLSGAAANRDSEPVFSADGSKIAFSSRRGGTFNIWVMNANGTGATNLTQDQTENGPGDPTWSPDGTKIAFAAATEGLANSEIYTINADGTGLVQVTNTPAAVPGGSESDPTWSPDGTKLAFAEASSCGGGRGIFVMDVDGSNRVEVTDNADTSCEDQPSWSPDGAKLAFINGGEVWTVNANGTNPVELPTNVRTFKGVAWSPDGLKLTFANEQGNISVIGADGGGEQELTDLDDVEQTPDWGPGVNEIEGTEAGETIVGTAGNDLIFAGGGHDTIDGGGGFDTIHGELGNDIIVGGQGDDIMFGGGGNDTISDCDANGCGGTHGNDTLDGGIGNDTLTFDAVSECEVPCGGIRGEVLGGAGNDTLDVTGIDDLLNGGAGADIITYDVIANGGSGDACCRGLVLGGGGNDSIDTSGPTLVKGGGGGDTISEGCPTEAACNPPARLLGGGGNDEITGIGGNAVLLGGPGDDDISGCNGQGKCGGDGRIAGGGGNDTISDCDDPPCGGVHGKVLGGSGNDEITGLGRADLLSGGTGNDTIFAKNGVKDVISGGPGTDKAEIDRRLDRVSSVEDCSGGGGRIDCSGGGG